MCAKSFGDTIKQKPSKIELKELRWKDIEERVKCRIADSHIDFQNVVDRVNADVECHKGSLNRSQLKGWNDRVKNEMNKYWKNLVGLPVKEKKKHCNMWVAWGLKDQEKTKAKVKSGSVGI
jgi:hypothetical protein